MDDLLKKLAALDNAKLTIYELTDPNYKKPRKPRTKRVKETPVDQPNEQPTTATVMPVKPPKPEPVFDFEDFARRYESVCEADFELSKMTQKELEELGYFEASDSETEGHFNIDGKKKE